MPSRLLAAVAAAFAAAPRPAAAPPPAPAARAGLCAPVAETDCAGSDVGIAQAASTSADCCERCKQTDRCAAWTYSYGTTCYLKTDCSGKKKFLHAVSGFGPAPTAAPGNGTGNQTIDRPPAACTWGCASLIVFFGGGAVYLAAGFAYNFKRNELRGVDALPHVSFWKDFPSLVKDGVTYSFRKARGGYQNV